MAYKVTTIYRRPSLDIPWHIERFYGDNSEQYIAVQALYNMNSRRVLKGSNTLVLTIENLWDSKDQFYEYNNNLGVIYHMERVAQYHEEVGIISEPRIYEEI